MKKEGRSVQFHFYVSEQEAAAIQERMEQIGVANLSAYLRKMAVDGYIIHLDMSGGTGDGAAPSYLLQQLKPVRKTGQ